MEEKSELVRHLADSPDWEEVFLTERYIVKPTGVPNLWCVWDRSHGVVFGAEALSKEQAEVMARRLNEAWRRTQ